MVAKVVKLLAVPAALGLASCRVYSMTDEKTDNISPQDLSIYITEPPALQYVEKAGRLQTGFGLIRARLRPYFRVLQDSCTSVKVGAISLYQAGQDMYHFLRDPSPGFLPRLGIITVSGLAGVILARKGSRVKRIGVSFVMTSIGAAVCYPIQTVGVLKVTSKKVYAASSSVASAFKSTPKVEGAVGDHASEKVPSMPNGESAPGTAPITEVVAAVPGISTATVAVVEKTASASEEPLMEVSPAVDIAPAEGSPDLALTNVIQCEVAAGLELATEEKATPPSFSLDAEGPTPSILVVEEALPPPAEESTHCPPSNEKPRFVPDPSLLDHGQAHPEDADLYSTRE